jgi:hypothetical protein
LVSLVGALSAALAFLFSLVDRTAYPPQILAEMGGSLAVLAIGIGLGCAFSPTDERRAALLAIQLGLLAYGVAVITLIRLV